MKCVIVRVCMCIDFRQRPFEFFSELFLFWIGFYVSVRASYSLTGMGAEFSKVYPCCRSSSAVIYNSLCFFFLRRINNTIN